MTIENRERRLRAPLRDAATRYDYVIVDTPPSLGLLTLNALTAADAVLVPMQCEYYALEGLSDLQSTIRLVSESLNPGLAIEGIVLCMVDPRQNLTQQVTSEVRAHFDGKVYDTTVPRNVRLSEAPVVRQADPALRRRVQGRAQLPRSGARVPGPPAGRTRPRPRWARDERAEAQSARPRPGGVDPGRALPCLDGGRAGAGAGARRREGTTALRTIAIEDVHPATGQPRKTFDDARLEELAASIRTQGIIQPLVVRARAGGGYELIAGERRWRAAQRAGPARGAGGDPRRRARRRRSRWRWSRTCSART